MKNPKHRFGVFLLMIAFLGPKLTAQETTADRRKQLESERASLQKRMAAIDAELASLEPTGSGASGLELTADFIDTEVVQAPYDYALPVRIAGRPWKLERGQRLQIIGVVKRTVDSYWRVTDGIRTGYVRNLGVDVLRDGAELSPYKDVDRAIDELSGTWNAHLFSLAEGRKLLVLGVFPDGPNSAAGVGVKIVWRHLDAGRTIKYATFSITPYNAVGDRVADRISGATTRKVRATGPLDARIPGVAQFDEESWFEPAWYNGSISCLHLERIDLEFMDGSTAIYSSDLANVLSPEFQNDCTSR